MSFAAALFLMLAPPPPEVDGLESSLAEETSPEAETDETEKAEEKHDYPEARLYDPEIDASAAVDDALARAAERKVNVLIVLGANWCHDSRAFAGWSESERIGALIAERFEIVFINVGMPQEGDGHNQHIVRRFGLENQEGTPMVIMASYDGIILNPETAQSWRNTASRSEDEIYEELAMMATTELARD